MRSSQNAIRHVYTRVARAALGIAVLPALLVAAPARAQEADSPRFSRALAVETFDSAWTLIARSHYDPSFGGLDWDAVRTELRPEAEAATSMAELRATIVRMLERIGESHHVLIPREVADAIEPGDQAESEGTPDPRASEGAPGDVGIEARVIGQELVVWRVDEDGPAAGAGVRPGWVIERVAGRDIGEGAVALASLADIDRRRALTRFLMSAQRAMEGSPGSAVTMRFRDGADRVVDRELVRRATPGTPVRLGNLPTMLASASWDRVAVDGGCVGVIRWNIWMLSIPARLDSAVHELRTCRGMVLDVRGNPGGVAGMMMGVAGHFFEHSDTLARLRTRSGELYFPANPRRVAPDGTPVDPYAGPVAILTDVMSVSTSELFAGGMQAVGRARVFGEATSGQALPAAAARLPNNDVLMYVLADATTPDGRRIEGAGVIPDQTVPLSREALLAGKDAPLEAAIAWILSTVRAR